MPMVRAAKAAMVIIFFITYEFLYKHIRLCVFFFILRLFIFKFFLNNFIYLLRNPKMCTGKSYRQSYFNDFF